MPWTTVLAHSKRLHVRAAGCGLIACHAAYDTAARLIRQLADTPRYDSAPPGVSFAAATQML